MVGLATFNLIWLELSLTGVLFPAATLGMYAITNSIAHGSGQHPEDYFQAIRSLSLLGNRADIERLLMFGKLPPITGETL